MHADAKVIFIVEDDHSVRDALALFLGLTGYSVRMFADAESFLRAYRPEWRGCLLLDIRMPGMDGLALQERLREMRCDLPVVVMTAHGDVESARAAFRAHAVDFLEKPLDHDRLARAIAEGLAAIDDKERGEQRRLDYARLIRSLTPREREVMDLVVAGRHNREIAIALAISVRTVEVHKARMMAKLNVDGVAELVRMHMAGDGQPGGTTAD